MCTIAILFGVTESPLVLAANRDELYARPTRPPERDGALLAGVDELSGGTWMAVHARGRFAAVTNQRALDVPPPGLRSRGLAVKELALADDQDAYVAALDPRAYASMNLVWGDASRVRVGYLRRETGEREVIDLPRGVHVMCNDRIGAPGFPRGERFARAIDVALAHHATWPELAAALERALGDHTRAAQADVPPSHLPPEIARELTATCIHTDRYGTRSSTIVALEPGRVVHYLHAAGPPCTTPFRELVQRL